MREEEDHWSGGPSSGGLTPEGQVLMSQWMRDGDHPPSHTQFWCLKPQAELEGLASPFWTQRAVHNPGWGVLCPKNWSEKSLNRF